MADLDSVFPKGSHVFHATRHVYGEVLKTDATDNELKVRPFEDTGIVGYDNDFQWWKVDESIAESVFDQGQKTGLADKLKEMEEEVLKVQASLAAYREEYEREHPDASA